MLQPGPRVFLEWDPCGSAQRPLPWAGYHPLACSLRHPPARLEQESPQQLQGAQTGAYPHPTPSNLPWAPREGAGSA